MLLIALHLPATRCQVSQMNISALVSGILLDGIIPKDAWLSRLAFAFAQVRVQDNLTNIGLVSEKHG